MRYLLKGVYIGCRKTHTTGSDVDISVMCKKPRRSLLGLAAPVPCTASTVYTSAQTEEKDPAPVAGMATDRRVLQRLAGFGGSSTNSARRCNALRSVSILGLAPYPVSPCFTSFTMFFHPR